MDKQSRTYQAYVQILKEELIPAMGCTEPIAIAYAAAKARDVLGVMPDKVEIGVSSNIIKNVKSVIVPNTDGMKGIEAAAAAGIVGGQADKALEVIAAVTADQKAAMRTFLTQVPVTVKAIDNGFIFDIIVTLQQGSDSAVVRICQYHTNIVLIQRNSEVLLDHTAQETKQLCGDAAPAESGLTDRALLNIADIFTFADTCEINDIRPLLETQIRYNTRISEEGLRGDYGANIGSTMLKFYGEDVRNRAIAKAAAGSDARMSGCELPVVINSGSGNQGITVSVPVIEYARELGASDETLCRALALSNLIAIHEKAGIGRLSAYCGAVSAGCAAGCGIAYLQGADLKAVSHTLVNALPSFRVLSAMVPRPAVRRRSPPAWRRVSWGITCTKTASNSAVGMASSQRALKIRSVMWDCWAVRVCAKQTKRSCGSCCRSRKAAAVEDRDYL